MPGIIIRNSLPLRIFCFFYLSDFNRNWPIKFNCMFIEFIEESHLKVECFRWIVSTAKRPIRSTDVYDITLTNNPRNGFFHLEKILIIYKMFVVFFFNIFCFFNFI